MSSPQASFIDDECALYVYCHRPVSENESICKMGFDDSKQLKDSQREQYLRDIMAHPSIGYVLSNITAQEIAEVWLIISCCNNFVTLHCCPSCSKC